MSIALFFAVGLVIVCVAMLRRTKPSRGERPSHCAFILHTSVTHARLLPAEAKHAFTYPALFLMVSLRALEEGKLDTGFGFSCKTTSRYPRLLGISPRGYLSNSGQENPTLVGRLEVLLGGKEAVDDAWMLTMPGFLGWEGINPLTVYLTYSNGSLRFAVLEIHNTFGESHVHILEVGVNEDSEATTTRGYDHQWTFRRQFHVSPFNDRSGYYTVAIKRPAYAPGAESAHLVEAVKPSISVKLYTESSSGANEKGPLKLTALLRTTSSHPLATTSDVLYSLAKMPFELLMTMPRILYQAGVLAFRKQLAVYLRPEPLNLRRIASSEDAARPILFKVGEGGVRWLREGLFERYARKRVEAFLNTKAAILVAMRTQLVLVPANPDLDIQSWPPEADRGSLEDEWQRVKITYLSSKVFLDLLLSPSPALARAEGTRTGVWSVEESTPGLLESIFCGEKSEESPKMSALQRIRAWAWTTIAGPNNAADRRSPVHFLDAGTSLGRTLTTLAIIATKVAAESLESMVFGVLGVRIAPPRLPITQDRPSQTPDAQRAPTAGFGPSTDMGDHCQWVGSLYTGKERVQSDSIIR